MLRLRTTTTLSLLALGVGIAGTQWLCGFNTGWAGPSERVAGFMPAAHRPAAHALRHHAPGPPRTMAAAHRAMLPPMVDIAQASPTPPPELLPVSMPQMPVSWSQMEGHLQGRVLLHLAIDGNGRVADASVAGSSGDPVLDAHALGTVRHWRFAVPADHPDGFSGDLQMSFTRGGQQVAEAP